MAKSHVFKKENHPGFNFFLKFMPGSCQYLLAKMSVKLIVLAGEKTTSRK